MEMKVMGLFHKSCWKSISMVKSKQIIAQQVRVFWWMLGILKEFIFAKGI
jgi:hypothetical protein